MDIQQRQQLRIVTGVPGGQQHSDRAARLVGQGMDLRREPAPRPPQSVIGGLGRQILVIRRCPL